MLCEVALGKMKQYVQGPEEELEAAPAGFDSVQGTRKYWILFYSICLN